MTPPTDSLEAALSETPCLVCQRGWLAHPLRVHGPTPCSIWQPDPPALAAAAREWMRGHTPHDREEVGVLDGRPTFSPFARGHNAALADMAKALGLEERS